MGLLAPAAIDAVEAERIIQNELRWMLAASEPYALVLFGSAARGALTEASDLDFALIYEDRESLEAGRRSIHSRRPPASWPADFLFYTTDEFKRRLERGGVCELIAAEGRILHGRLP